MEGDSGVKAAPVTRLRRRLSVEQPDLSDTISPSAPSTPTKKRGGRLAAKPNLELIDENVPQNSPKRATRKSIARDIVEEEKPVTPSRRSTRIKSNTSIVLDTVQAFDSPRAKRAARRTSLVGSDNEAPLTTPTKFRRTRRDSTSSVDKASPSSDTLVTPGRTRRTRKDSTSSFDKQADTGPSALITEVISEEPEKSLRNNEATADSKDLETSPSVRKSPRLAKTAKKNDSRKSDVDNENQTQDSNETSEKSKILESAENNTLKDGTEIIEPSEPKDKLSVSSTTLINDLDTEPRKSKKNVNKSMPALKVQDNSTRRHRTKSWSNLSVFQSNEGNFYSDNESAKKKLKKQEHFLKGLSNQTGSGDGPLNTSKDVDKSDTVEEAKEITEIIINSSKKNKMRSECSFTTEIEASMKELTPNKSENLKKFPAEALDISNESNKENLLGVHPKNVDSSATELLFEKTPSNDIKLILFIEDSDTDSVGKVTSKQSDKDDQCVPVVDHKLEDSTKNLDQSVMTVQNKVLNNFVEENMKTNDSCEPMDIDETMPENVSLTEFSKENEQVIDNETQINGSLKKSKRTSSMSNSTAQTLDVSQGAEEKVNESVNKSKRKSFVSNSMSQSFNTSKGSEEKINETNNKSKRKSSISNSIAQTLNVSQGPEEKVNESVNISKENSSVSNSMSQSCNTSKGSEKKMYATSNNSKRKSSISNSIAQTLNVSNGAEEKVNESVNKPKKKSSISNSMLQSFNTSKASEKQISDTNNKSKRNSSISNSLSPDLEKTGNENKSTLILSQIKDVSSTENNVSKSPQVSNEHLSKSMDVPDGAKDDMIKNKNISLNYLTSTPVNQKDNIKKLGMQMNTSVITPNNANKKELGESKNISKNDESILSEASEDSDSSEEESDDEEEESSQDKSNLMDDEAEDAGDDYESGDSQDEEERQYEKENEILDRGETLTSDDEISNDSDYEKDSFIVSSDEEDNDLLSGSGDDLGSSDNELTMSAKSKKKYNEHKFKEQKKASKEMYEARHKLNKSDQSSKKDRIKKSHQRLDSSLVDSEEDAKLPPKKKGRLRLDSSMISEEEVASNNKNVSVVSEPEEIGYKKKKSKRLRLSESMCNDSIMNEKEITVCNEGNSDIDDPLLVKVKQEPKTPQKPLDISTVHFIDRQEVEQVEVDENASIMKINETNDPLQATMAQDDEEEESDDGSISENEEIANNYETMLKELNKDNKPKQIKSSDISLNLNKKSKNKNEPIIEQLNLTQTKKSKKNKNSEVEKFETKSAAKKIINSNEDEASSDSIDMKLLFSDDSNNGSEKNCGSGKKECDEAEKFIPLKRTDGKTNIREDDTEDNNVNYFVDTTGTNGLHTSINVSLNTSSKKKKNKKNSISLAEDVQDDDKKQEASLNFFVDTRGTRADLDASNNTSLSNSSMKKKNKNNSISFAEEPVQKDDITGTEDGDSNDAPTETSYRSEKNKKQFDETSEDCEDVKEKAGKTSTAKTQSGDKKKKKLSESHEPSVDVTDAAQNVSLNSSKLKKLNTTLDTVNLVKDEKPSQEGVELSSKKRKRKSSANMSVEALLESTNEVLKAPDVNESTLSGSNRKKRKISHNNNSAQNRDAACSQAAASDFQEINVNKKKIKRSTALENKLVVTCEPEVEKKAVNKKRKERDDDDFSKKPKVLKENSSDKIHVPRLPTTLLSQLDDKPNGDVLETRKARITSTTDFMVEETVKRKNKPSQYLEESIYLNNSEAHVVKKQKTNIKRPKVLPFIPTASTSDSGFTTKFQVNVLPKKIEFVAQKSDVPNFKNDFLNNNKLKRLRTYELYRNHRSVKLSKY